MGEILVLATNIEFKTKKLVEQCEKNKEEKNQLIEKNEELKQKTESQRKEIQALKEKNKLLQIAKSIKSTEGKTEIKLKINEMVREIDNCIALLNK